MGVLLQGFLLGPAVQLGVREIRSTPVGDVISAKGGRFGRFPCHFSDFSGAISAQVRQKVVGATVRPSAKKGVCQIWGKTSRVRTFYPKFGTPLFGWVVEVRSTPAGEAISAKGRRFGYFPCLFCAFLGAIPAQVRQKVFGATVRMSAKFGVKRHESRRFTPTLAYPLFGWVALSEGGQTSATFYPKFGNPLFSRESVSWVF